MVVKTNKRQILSLNRMLHMNEVKERKDYLTPRYVHHFVAYLST